MPIWRNKKNSSIDQCKVSIIVPVFQAEKYIGRCLKSLIAQNLDEYEILCVDDGSTDHSAEIIHEFMEKNQKIRYFFQHNRGVSAARNLGMRNAQGCYLMFVDADDYIKKNVLKQLYDKAEENKLDILVFGGKMEKAWRAPEWMRMAFYSHNRIYTKFQLNILFDEPGSLPSVCNKLISSKCVNNIKFVEQIHIAEDMTFLCLLFPMVNNIQYLSKRIYRYRLSNELSAMHDTEKYRMTYMENHILAAETIVKGWKTYGLIEEKNKREILEWMTAFLRAPYKLLNCNEKKIFDARINSLYQLFKTVNMLRLPERKFDGKNTVFRYVKILVRDIQKYGINGGIENILYKIVFRS